MSVPLDVEAFRKVYLQAMADDAKYLAALTPDKRDQVLAQRKAKYQREQVAWQQRKAWLDWCVANGRDASGNVLTKPPK